jgi:hypothetical protein
VLIEEEVHPSPINEPDRLTQDLRVAAPKLEQLSPAMEREAIDLGFAPTIAFLAYRCVPASGS